MDGETVTSIVQVIEGVGVLGLLVLIVVAMYKGWVWPKENVDKMLDAQRDAAEQSAKIIASEMGEKMKNGVAEGMEIGISRGYLKINAKKD